MFIFQCLCATDDLSVSPLHVAVCVVFEYLYLSGVSDVWLGFPLPPCDIDICEGLGKADVLFGGCIQSFAHVSSECVSGCSWDIPQSRESFQVCMFESLCWLFAECGKERLFLPPQACMVPNLGSLRTAHLTLSPWLVPRL